MAGNKSQGFQAVCKKNDSVELEITDMGLQGEGIGRINGYTLFVKDAIIGDVVQACVTKTKKKYGYARMTGLIKPSAYRVEPVCPVARPCGGCQLQHCSYEKQLAWKEAHVKDCLNRIGGFQVALPGEARGQAGQIVMEPILAMDEPYHYRNKAQLPVGRSKDGRVTAGFYAGRTHSIVGTTDCAIQHPVTQRIADAVLEFMEAYDIPPYDEETHEGLVRHILIRVGTGTGQVMVCLVINGTVLPHSTGFVEKMLACPLEDGFAVASICLNVNCRQTNVILGETVQTLYGADYIEDRIGGIRYRISPLSFYQVNPEQTRKLYETALEYADLQGGEMVWDLYCGIGTISLFLAQKAARVYGVEIVPQAVQDARANAALNGMANAEFYAGAAEEVVPRLYEKNRERFRADVVTLDPPRKGCEETLLQTVIQMQPDKIVYVSCNPATLARDLRYLCDRGYALQRVRACDMFGQSYHVETVVLLSKLHSEHHIEVELHMDEMDLTAAESKATYEEIKAYVLEHSGLNVSNLYIAQVKQKYGIIERECYNKLKSEDSKQPKCPPEKEAAITEALKYFKMI